jgi:hypothetical protein
VSPTIAGNASTHFPWAELACHDGTPVPIELVPNAVALADLLEVVRFQWGGPLLVVSGYRTEEYNRRVGGAPRSQHVLARAADVRPVHVHDVPRLADLIRANVTSPSLKALGGWGVYPQWVHLDVRPRPESGHVAFWYGSGVGSEEAA